MFLSKLNINAASREFRRDHADIREMHRTMMSAYPQVTDGTPARQSHAVLWRLDGTYRGFVQYVQSQAQPDWSSLPAAYLTEPAMVRSLQPVIDAIAPGRRFAFRLAANPTRRLNPAKTSDDGVGQTAPRTMGKLVAHRTHEAQIGWLIRQGERHGFVIPAGRDGQPDVTTSPCPTLNGRRRQGDKGNISIAPARFEGHLVVVDAQAFASALRLGIGRGKAYGCGLVSIAPARTG